MKKIIASLLLVGAMAPAFAGPHGHGYHGSALRVQHHGHVVHSSHWRHHSGGWNWMVPAIIGGAVVYSATRPDPVVVQQPVIVQTPVQITQKQNCSPWTETENPDGTITRTRTCTQ
jgi:hypothetical protein